MFSLIFFAIVAFILIVGVVVTSMRKKSRGIPQATNETEYDRNLSDDAALRSRSRSNLNEGRVDNTGSIVPASNEDLRSGFNDDDNETNTNIGPANRPVV